MWQGPTILMDQGYPFGAAPNANPQKCLVKRKLHKTQSQLEKTKILALLKHDCLIKLQSLEEEDNEYWLLFEYIPLSIQKWYGAVNRQFIENYQQRLILFSRYLSDKSVIVTFRRDNMGVTEAGDPKYFLDTNFVMDPSVNKLDLKKKYKEQIRELIQYYIDKKNSSKSNSIKPSSDKKQNSKVLKILQAIEKGKANLCAQTPKQTSLAVVTPRNIVAESKNNVKSSKNMNLQNIFIQKQVAKMNKIQVMMGNKPVEVLQQQFKRQYASSSFYLNGVPTMKIEREGQARRLFSPTDKLTRFQQVKYKEYKTMKASGEVYVQQFVNVLENDDSQKLTLPGSPRGTLYGSPRSTFQSPPSITLPSTKMITGNPPKLAIQCEPKRETKQIQPKSAQSILDRLNSPKGKTTFSNRFPQQRQQLKNSQKQELFTSNSRIALMNENKSQNPPVTSSKAIQIQKKVSQAIANSMNAISKFKNAAKTNHINL